MNGHFDFEGELQRRKELFEGYMNDFCASLDSTEPLRIQQALNYAASLNCSIPHRLQQAMNYSLSAGGKRIRPVLCLSGARLFGCDDHQALPMALAFEMVHTASLIHDDLPCMDNDTLRRGKPTNHVVFGETLALLAGDALFLFAFETALTGLAKARVSPERCVKAVTIFAEALGPMGICGGQVLDTDAESRNDSKGFVMEIASMKTMVLIRAAIVAGAVIAGADDESLRRLWGYGTNVGLAFQIADDILDCTGNQAEMGKTLGKDAVQDKRTFVRAFGLEGAKAKLAALTSEAVELLAPWGDDAQFLRELAFYLERRTN